MYSPDTLDLSRYDSESAPVKNHHPSVPAAGMLPVFIRPSLLHLHHVLISQSAPTHELWTLTSSWPGCAWRHARLHSVDFLPVPDLCSKPVFPDNLPAFYACQQAIRFIYLACFLVNWPASVGDNETAYPALSDQSKRFYSVDCVALGSLPGFWHLLQELT